MARRKNKEKNTAFKPPEYLSSIAKSKWNDLLSMLESRKVITISDLIALETLCINYAMSIDLYKAMVDQSSDGTAAGYFIGRNSQTTPQGCPLGWLSLMATTNAKPHICVY